MRRFGLLNIVLLALIALATWRTIDVWRRELPARELPADDAARAPADLPPAPRKPPLPQMVAGIADKDLFDASRKPADAAAPAAAPTPAPPPPTLKLAGVIVVGRQREALLLDTGQANRQIRMREGEEISGYKVGKIETEQISLVGGGGEEIQLLLQIEKNKGGGGGKKGAFGPGGKPAAPTAPGARGGGGLQPPPGPPPGAPQPMQGARAAGGIAPSDPATEARQRAESARERLKRLRAEAAGQ